MLILCPKLSNVKPPVGTPINWAHPYANGLIGAWLLSDMGVFDGVYQQVRTIVGTPTTIIADDGVGMRFPTASDYLTYARRGTDLQTENVACSFMARVYAESSAGSSHTVLNYGCVTDNNNTISFGVNTQAVPPSVGVGTGGGVATGKSVNTFAMNTWATIGCAQRSATDRTFLTNGLLDTNAGNMGSSASAGGLSLGTGFVNQVAASGFIGRLSWVYAWARGLANEELQGIYAAPFSFWGTQSPQFRMLSGFASGVVAAALRRNSSLNGLGASGPFFHGGLN